MIWVPFESSRPYLVKKKTRNLKNRLKKHFFETQQSFFKVFLNRLLCLQVYALKCTLPGILKSGILIQFCQVSRINFDDNPFLIAPYMNLCSSFFFTAPGSFWQIMTSGDYQTNIIFIWWYPDPIFTMRHNPIVSTNSRWPFVKIFLQPFLFQMSFFVIRKRWTGRITEFRFTNLIGWWINQMKETFDCFLFRFKVDVFKTRRKDQSGRSATI